MITITVDIPDDKLTQVLAELKKIDVEIKESTASFLDGLTKADYTTHFEYRAKINRTNIDERIFNTYEVLKTS